MPEGHTLHRLAREHTRLLAGRHVRAASPQGRFDAGAARLDGRVLEDVEAHGKHILYAFRGLADRLHVHLGLYGVFSTGAVPAPAPRGALRLRLVTDEAWVDLRGPSACELLTPDGVERLRSRLGPDPLRTDARPDVAYRRISRSRAPIGALLLDQSVVAGVGNVYRAESLFRQGIAPARPGAEVDPADWDALWRDLVRLMRAGVRAGRIVTTRPEHRSRRSGAATRADSFYLWRRTGLPCRVCGTPITSDAMAARTIYWCPTCQPA